MAPGDLLALGTTSKHRTAIYGWPGTAVVIVPAKGGLVGSVVIVSFKEPRNEVPQLGGRIQNRGNK